MSWADLVQESLKEGKVEGRKQRKTHKTTEMAENNLYTIIKVVRDEDFAEQIGNDLYFDLVDLDKVRSFRVQKQASFNVFKENVAKEFGIPAQFQRFWLWEKRENHTCRPSRLLTHIDEAQSVGVGQLRELHKVDELKLFLEVERGLEIRFEPKVKCFPIEKKLTFEDNELDNGDIICFQKASAIDTKKHIRYPNVLSYMEYVYNRQVPFCPSDIESEDEASLEEQNENITDEEMNDMIDEEINDMIDEDELLDLDDMVDVDVIGAIDKVISEGLSIIDFRYLQLDLPDQLLQELRDIAFKKDLVVKFKLGLAREVNFNVVKDKIEANADMLYSRELKQVHVVVNFLNKIEWMFEKLEKLEKERYAIKKSTDQDNEELKATRQKILLSKTSLDIHQTELNSLDTQIADLKAMLEKLQGERAKIVEIEAQEKAKITSLNKEVKSIFHRLAIDQVKLKIADQIPEAETELEGHEKVYKTLRAIPPF
ncbi:ubiquitin carboxyl-terminal hydrolase 13 [Medicago truncatula]|uniref:ubiquitin carboxyl-terminal hydrolase 13 n=1 Tax=Medicago truncatula TaxID=3880 RepID=UPI000D2F32C0|nr:ubiquitin carboxyl-terminal hydrolase 13 [Medicago truncatula]